MSSFNFFYYQHTDLSTDFSSILFFSSSLLLLSSTLSHALSVKMAFTIADLSKYISAVSMANLDHNDRKFYLDTLNKNGLKSFLDLITPLGLAKSSASAAASSGGGGGGGGSAAASSSRTRCFGTRCNGKGVPTRHGCCDLCLLAMEAADRARAASSPSSGGGGGGGAAHHHPTRHALPAPIESDRVRRERELADHQLAVALAEQQRREQLHREQQRHEQQRREQQQERVNIHFVAPGSLGGNVVVRREGAPPMVVSVNGAPRFGQPTIQQVPFWMPGFGPQPR